MFLTINNSPSVKCSIEGPKKVAVHEIFYTIDWFNISVKKGNNWIKLNKKIITIEDGYYNACTLIKEVFEPNEIKGTLQDSNLRLTLTWKKDQSLEIEDQLADMLGLKDSKPTSDSSSRYLHGSHPVKMSVHKQLFLHLKELQSSDNFVNGSTSYLLRPLPVSSAPYMESVHVTFPNLQYKKLTEGYIHTLTPELRNEKGDIVECSNLIIVLEII